jgi:arabinogalactan oligomer/maltooligosaccharide transport system permease protein
LDAEIVVWHAYKGAEEAALAQAAGEWSAAHGVPVRTVEVPWGAFDSKVETAVPRGNGPDLFVTGHANVVKWDQLGVLDVLATQAPDVPLLPGALDVLHADGGYVGWPLALKSPVLLYDPQQVTDPPETTDELLAQARALTGDGRYGIAYEAATAYYHAGWMHGFGASAYGADGLAHLDSPEQIAALAFVAELGSALPVRPSAERTKQLYEDGQAAFVISGPWFVADLKRPIAAAPLPTVSSTGEPARPYLTIESVFLAKGADDVAKEFAADLAFGRGSEIRKDVGGQVLSRTDVTYDDPLRNVLLAQAAVSVPLPTDPGVQTVFEAQSRALRRVLRGATSPENAAVEAQAYWRSLTKPPPEPAPVAPYALLAGVAALGAAGWFGRDLLDADVRRRIAAHRWDYAWVLPATLVVTLLVVVPFLTGATVSLFATHGGEWTFVGLRNFADILLSRDWPISSPMSFFFTLGVTVLWTVSNVVLHVGLGMAAALVLREPWIRLRPVWRGLLILPWAVPNYITALIWRSMFDAQYGAVNALLGFVSGRGEPAPIDWFGSFSAAFCANLTTNTWLGFPFMMVVTLGALQAIPRELEEAAEVDGAGWWWRFRHVVWPLLRPALLPAVVLGSVWTFNMFNVVYLVSAGEPDGATEILISQAYRWAFSRGNLYGYAAAYAVVIFGVLVIYSRGMNRILGKKVL